MKITISGRHMEVTDAIRTHVEEALKRLESHFDKVIDADVVLEVEKHRHIAEVNVHANGMRVHCKESSLDMYSSVDAVIHKLERQCLKYKGRINRHQPRVEEARRYEYAIIAPGNGNGNHEIVKDEFPKHREIHRETLSMKPLTVDEAVLQLELTEDLFLVFSNAATAQVNVLYRCSDGTFGLIEPQF